MTTVKTMCAVAAIAVFSAFMLDTCIQAAGAQGGCYTENRGDGSIYRCCRTPSGGVYCHRIS